MKFFLFIIFLFISQNIYSLELECYFEEVYQDGSSQQGIFLLKGENLRYQYFDKELYTIINNSDGLHLVNNSTRLPQPLQVNYEIIDFLIEQSNLFPNNLENYSSVNFNAEIIKSKNNIFIKNIIIKKKNINLNIHFFDCKNTTNSSIVFHHNPMRMLK